ncbi:MULTISPECIES: hypothetical protein [Maribellus]|uniref:Uncharacterized protein n=1 Tax=Maribellus comscasis TaxID=2681766 RepID=A0A6I6JW08_9BACT|nr:MULTISPECIES: hypothetical protein [Maribellus]MCG6188070.1 hypothetical protein [Maribellus maritimus]QGY47316.1 hypothetical protein GM418_27710 [Maribellus comscasis]
MKARVLFLIVCVALLSLGANAKIRDGKALSGNSLTEFGKYTIVNSDAPMVIDNKVVKTYDLMYDDVNGSVRIGVLKEKDCTSFVVRSDEFEVMYECNKHVFGVKKIDKKFQTLPTASNNEKLNKVSYYAQRVICQNPKTEDELLGLIACYFPNLINDEYQASF